MIIEHAPEKCPYLEDKVGQGRKFMMKHFVIYYHSIMTKCTRKNPNMYVFK